MIRKMVCIWFPQLSVQRHLFETVLPDQRGQAIVAVYQKIGAQKPWIRGCSPAAHAIGISTGMTLAEAESLVPAKQALAGNLAFVPFDPHDDEQFLRRLAVHCQRYSPLCGFGFAQPVVTARKLQQVSRGRQASKPKSPEPNRDGADCLLLDVTGCFPLFHDPQHLLAMMRADLAQQGFDVRLALASTPGAAWAFAHSMQHHDAVITPEQLPKALAGLPVDLLRLDLDQTRFLHELGVKTVGQLEQLPRQELPVRFGESILHRLDQALGRQAETVAVIPQPDPVSINWIGEEPVRYDGVIEQLLMQLIDQIVRQLHERQLAARELVCTLIPAPSMSVKREATKPEEQAIRLTIGVATPCNLSARFQKLARLQLEQVKLKSPIAKILLDAKVEPLPICRQQNLFGDADESTDQTELLSLLELLSHRLGYDRLLSAEVTPDILPEDSARFVPWLLNARQQTVRPTANPGWSPASGLIRPMTLLSKPQLVRVHARNGTLRSFRWQMQEKTIAQVWGPERLATGWWDQNQQRDYYRVETTAGERFWLYQSPAASWFLHGIFD